MFLTTELATQRPSRDLLPAVLAAVDVPVIAAGGFGDRRAVAWALEAGAAAAQAGTAFLLSDEATTSGVHRAALRQPRETALTNLFTGRPARGVLNRLMRELGPIRAGIPPFPLAAGALARLRAAAEARGNGGFSPLWAGAGPVPLEAPATHVLDALVTV
jgi:nitronate monooxygenase